LKDNIIDARGRACPEPVLMTKKALAQNPEGIKILVDNITARENIRRFAANSGYIVDITSEAEDILLTLGKK
jgi:TusA-related sulfurtransferase